MSKEDAYMDGLLHAHLDALEAAAESQVGWIEARAEELLTEPEMVYDITSHHLMPVTDYEHLIPELLRDMVLLHNKHQSDLLNSDLMTRLYQTARTLYDQAMEFAARRAEGDFEKTVKESENARAKAMMSDWDD